MADDLMYPELDVESPLPEVEILSPPGRHPVKPAKPATSQPVAARQSVAEEQPPPGQDYYGTQTAPGGRPPLGIPPPAAADPRDSEEVKQRILRERRRAVVSLITFVVGILVMTVFAFLVVRFSRPS
jgi:hypothetical protein